MGKTRTITVDDTAWVPVTASIYTKRVTIGEDPSVANWPTTDYKMARPTSADTPRQRPSGTETELQRDNGKGYFGPNDVVCYLRTVTGSTTFFVDEQAV